MGSRGKSVVNGAWTKLGLRLGLVHGQFRRQKNCFPEVTSVEKDVFEVISLKVSGFWTLVALTFQGAYLGFYKKIRLVHEVDI